MQGRTPREPRTDPSAISPAELETLRWLCTGSTNAEIAHYQHIKPSTVRSHLEAIMAKLGVDNRLAAVVEAHRTDLVDIKQPWGPAPEKEENNDD